MENTKSNTKVQELYDKATKIHEAAVFGREDYQPFDEAKIIFVEETRLSVKLIVARVFNANGGDLFSRGESSASVSRRRTTRVQYLFLSVSFFLFFFFFFFVLLLLISLESRSAREQVLRTDVQSR